MKNLSIFDSKIGGFLIIQQLIFQKFPFCNFNVSSKLFTNPDFYRRIKIEFFFHLFLPKIVPWILDPWYKLELMSYFRLCCNLQSIVLNLLEYEILEILLDWSDWCETVLRNVFIL